jgi:hypothetical protein
LGLEATEPRHLGEFLGEQVKDLPCLTAPSGPVEFPGQLEQLVAVHIGSLGGGGLRLVEGG